MHEIKESKTIQGGQNSYNDIYSKSSSINSKYLEDILRKILNKDSIEAKCIRAALKSLGPLGSLVPRAPPMHDEIRYCEKISADNSSGGRN